MAGRQRQDDSRVVSGKAPRHAKTNDETDSDLQISRGASKGTN